MLLNTEKDWLFFYLWSETDRRIHTDEFLRGGSYYIGANVTSLAAADFNVDGRLDLLVTSTSPQGATVSVLTQTHFGFQETFNLGINADVRPSVLSVNSDLRCVPSRLDVLLNINGETTVLINNGTGFVPTPLETFADHSEGCLSGFGMPLSAPHSSASVDLNGDCLADLFLTVEDETGLVFYQVWLNGKNGMYCLVYNSPAPVGAGQVSFADVDRNGLEDLIFPVGNDSLHILFNDNPGSASCSFDASAISTERFQLQDLGAMESTANKLVQRLESPYWFYRGEADFPLTLRLADMDLDGYPDMIATLSTTSSQQSSVVFFSNTPCTSALCGVNIRRCFQISSDSQYDKLSAVPGIVGTFFDLDENGVMDIITTVLESDGTFAVVSFYNNFLGDTFHLKALMLDGDSFSASFPGAVFTYTVTGLNMDTTLRRCTQNPQTAWFALQPPYCLSGTGRTYNYIEDFWAALPFAKHSSRMWTPIIPNSDLIVSPTTDNTDDWTLKLFANPSAGLIYVIAASLICLVLLGAFIIWRYGKENKRDLASLKYT